jgi:hypothetical protein
MDPGNAGAGLGVPDLSVAADLDALISQLQQRTRVWLASASPKFSLVGGLIAFVYGGLVRF